MLTHRTLLFFLSISYTTGQAIAQWIEVSPSSVQVLNHGNLIGHDGLLFYSSELSGAYRSQDQGESWEDITHGLLDVSAFGHDGTYLYIGTSAGIHRSADDGDTWELATGAIALSSTNWVHRFRAIGNDLFVVLSADVNDGGGIYRTADHGTTWTACNTDLQWPTTAVTDLVEKGGRLFCANGNSIQVSDDHGSTWTATHAWQDVTIPGKALACFGDRLIVSMTGFANMIYSDDDGATWDEAVCPSSGGVYSSIVPYGGQLYALQYGDLCRSADQGLTWTLFNDGLDTASPAHLAEANGILYANADYRLYRLNDASAIPERQDLDLNAWHANEILRIATGTTAPALLRITDAMGRTALERRIAGPICELPFAPATGAYLAQLIDARGSTSTAQRFVVR